MCSIKIVLSIVAGFMVALLGAARADDATDPANASYARWPLSLNDPSVAKLIEAIPIDGKPEDELKAGLSAYRSVVSMGSAFSRWNPQFKPFAIDQAITARISHLGLGDGYVKPLIHAINLGYAFLSPAQADNNATVLIYGASSLDVNLGKHLSASLNEKLGRQISAPAWNNIEDFGALRASQLQTLGTFAPPSTVGPSTGFEADKIGLLQPYMPFAENPYFDVRNIFFGPGSQFERRVGYAAVGSRSEDGRVVNDSGKPNIDPKTFASSTGSATKQQEAAVDAAKCIVKCMSEKGYEAVTTVAGGVLVGKESPSKAVGWGGITSGLALTGCTLISCKDEIRNVEKLKEEQKKVERESNAEAEKRQTDCSKMSSQDCEEKKKSEQEQRDQEAKKKSDAASCESKDGVRCKSSGANAGSAGKCAQDSGRCADDPAAVEKCSANPQLFGCELHTFIANNCRDKGCNPAAPSGPLPSLKKQPVIVGTDDKVDLGDRQRQAAAASQFYSSIAAGFSSIPQKALGSSTLGEEGVERLKAALARPEISIQLQPGVRNELLQQLARRP